MNFIANHLLSFVQVDTTTINNEEITSKAILYSNIVMIVCALVVIFGVVWFYKNRTKQ